MTYCIYEQGTVGTKSMVCELGGELCDVMRQLGRMYQSRVAVVVGVEAPYVVHLRCGLAFDVLEVKTTCCLCGKHMERETLCQECEAKVGYAQWLAIR